MLLVSKIFTEFQVQNLYLGHISFTAFLKSQITGQKEEK